LMRRIGKVFVDDPIKRVERRTAMSL